MTSPCVELEADDNPSTFSSVNSNMWTLWIGLVTILSAAVLMSMALVRPSLPTCNFVTLPILHFNLGVRSSWIITTEPTFRLLLDLETLLRGRFLMYCSDHTFQNESKASSLTCFLCNRSP